MSARQVHSTPKPLAVPYLYQILHPEGIRCLIGVCERVRHAEAPLARLEVLRSLKILRCNILAFFQRPIGNTKTGASVRRR